MNYHGLYSYKLLDHQWTEEYRHPLLVKVDGEIAGFVLVILDVPKEYTKFSAAEKTNVISDFFIMRKFRRKGVGKKVAHRVFQQFQGVWEIKQTDANIAATAFWKHVITAYTSDSIYEEGLLRNELWNGPVFVFQS